jgi:hypothetical protein
VVTVIVKDRFNHVPLAVKMYSKPADIAEPISVKVAILMAQNHLNHVGNAVQTAVRAVTQVASKVLPAVYARESVK